MAERTDDLEVVGAERVCVCDGGPLLHREWSRRDSGQEFNIYE
jgi:hypothetical protein